ncbi:hypothetical protein ACFQJC_09290 [Haloferax namakaokahaiae]|uniref:DUF7513 domain-containing protein n=1 Tax=Haloferax namakaokahaiae TaxID=1748331 RepID=A0ABD5ZFP5_9EURY
MSWLDSFLAGWTFRTSTPAFEPGEVITAYVTDADAEGGIVRIGDSKIRLPDADAELVESKVRLEITAFDASTYEGTGTVVEVIGPDQ